MLSSHLCAEMYMIKTGICDKIDENITDIMVSRAEIAAYRHVLYVSVTKLELEAVCSEDAFLYRPKGGPCLCRT